MWEEFKTFAFKGNAFDLAIGVIIGAAFSRIVDGIVNLLIMPIIGAVLGGLNFDNYFLPLAPGITATNLVEAQKQGAVLGYGAFITILVNFLIVAFAVFLVVKAINKMQNLRASKAEETEELELTEVELLSEIRDLLVAQNGGAATTPSSPPSS